MIIFDCMFEGQVGKNTNTMKTGIRVPNFYVGDIQYNLTQVYDTGVHPYI